MAEPKNPLHNNITKQDRRDNKIPLDNKETEIDKKNFCEVLSGYNKGKNNNRKKFFKKQYIKQQQPVNDDQILIVEYPVLRETRFIDNIRFKSDEKDFPDKQNSNRKAKKNKILRKKRQINDTVNVAHESSAIETENTSINSLEEIQIDVPFNARSDNTNRKPIPRILNLKESNEYRQDENVPIKVIRRRFNEPMELHIEYEQAPYCRLYHTMPRRIVKDDYEYRVSYSQLPYAMDTYPIRSSRSQRYNYNDDLFFDDQIEPENILNEDFIYYQQADKKSAKRNYKVKSNGNKNIKNVSSKEKNKLRNVLIDAGKPNTPISTTDA